MNWKVLIAGAGLFAFTWALPNTASADDDDRRRGGRDRYGYNDHRNRGHHHHHNYRKQYRHRHYRNNDCCNQRVGRYGYGYRMPARGSVNINVPLPPMPPLPPLPHHR